MRTSQHIFTKIRSHLERNTRNLLFVFVTLLSACAPQNADDEAVAKIQEPSPASVYQDDSSSLDPLNNPQATKEPISQGGEQSVFPQSPLVSSLSPMVTIPETPTVTLTPKRPIFASMSKNSFCREGPNSSYRDITAVPAGDEIEVRGISEDKYWLYIYWGKFKVECWVVATSVALDIEPTVLLVMTASALPETGNPPNPKNAPSPVPATPTSKKP